MVSISGIEVMLEYRAPTEPIASGRGKVTFQISAGEEEILLSRSMVNVFAKLPDNIISFDAGAAEFEIIKWDKESWKPWDSTEKRLKHVDR